MKSKHSKSLKTKHNEKNIINNSTPILNDNCKGSKSA